MTRARRRRHDADVAERRARLAEIVDRVTTAPPAPPTSARDRATAVTPGVELDELVRAEVARQRAAEQEAAAAVELARFAHPDGTGCAHCGLSHCATYDTDRPRRDVPGWNRRTVGDHRGAYVCAFCDAELYVWADESDDARRRVRAALIALGQIAPSGDGRWPALALNDPAQLAGCLPWFIETTAAPSLERWAWLDVDRLRARWDAVLHPPAPAPPPLQRHEPCQVCGVADRWQPYKVTDVDGRTFPQVRCLGCRLTIHDVDVDEIVSGLLFELTGRQHVSGIAAELGLGLFVNNGPGRPQPQPFAWWGDIVALARHRWPDRAAFDAWHRSTHPLTGADR